MLPHDQSALFRALGGHLLSRGQGENMRVQPYAASGPRFGPHHGGKVTTMDLALASNVPKM
jgi:hypothetical protein